MWHWDEKIGQLTIKDSSEAITDDLVDSERKWWYRSLQKWHASMKILLFYWLKLITIFFTCDNFIKRGGEV